MNDNDYKIDIISRKSKGQQTYPARLQFVKATHIESNISVTGAGKTQLEAKLKSVLMLESIVEEWENI